MRNMAIASCAVALAGCASIVEGTSQEIFISATPETASCVAEQNGREVGQYSPRTMSMLVPKSRNDLLITCVAPGYKDKLVHIVSEASAWGVVGALTLDFGVVDYATGALNKYPASLTIVMEPEEAVAVGPPAAQAMAAKPAKAPAPPAHACTQDEAAQKRIAIENNYTLIPNCR